MGEPSRRRVTHGQLEHLWEFLIKHRDIAMGGYNNSSQTRKLSRKLWEEIAQSLNSRGDGAVKDWKGWCKYWYEYKSKIKKLATMTKSSQHKTDGSQSTIKPMTDLEKKYLQILGDDYSAGLPATQPTTCPQTPTTCLQTPTTCPQTPTTCPQTPTTCPQTPTTPHRPLLEQLLASPHTQLAPTSLHTQSKLTKASETLHIQRGLPGQKPLIVEKAQHIIAESRKLTKMQEAELKMFDILIAEIRQIKEII